MKPLGILVTLLAAMACALPAIAQSDETAKRFHVFPQLADGAGWQSTLLVTNVAQSSSFCTLELHGDLAVDRLEDIGITAAGSTATFSLPGPAGDLIWRTKNESALATGYATLDCAAPVVAQVLYASEDESGTTTGMATVFSSQPGAVFQFPVTPDARLGVAIANDTNTGAAACRVGLNAATATLSVPSKSNVAKFLHEVVQIPSDFTRGSATVSCDQQVSVMGLQFDGAIFTTLPAAVLSTTPVTPEFQGHWEGNLIYTRRSVPEAWEISGDEDCTGLCGFTPLAADLTQDGQTVTGSVRTTFSAGNNFEWTVHGEVSIDGTLSLTSEAILLPDTPIPVSVGLESWYSRVDTPGIMTGTATVHYSSDALSGTLVVEGCLGSGIVRENMECSGWRRDGQ